MKEKRGFEFLIGKTITSVNQESVNVVVINCKDGSKFLIEAEDRHYDIEIITCKRLQNDLS
jgi:hypothetical protein